MTITLRADGLYALEWRNGAFITLKKHEYLALLTAIRKQERW